MLQDEKIKRHANSSPLEQYLTSQWRLKKPEGPGWIFSKLQETVDASLSQITITH